MLLFCLWLFGSLCCCKCLAIPGDLDAVQVIDYSDLVVFDAFNGSYLSSQDYRGLSTSPNKIPGKQDLDS
jgi:hypothetical protein